MDKKKQKLTKQIQKYDDCVVSFVDLLGFSKKVLQSTSQTLPEILKTIKQFRQGYERGSKSTDSYFISFSDAVVVARKYEFAPFFREILGHVYGISESIYKGHFVRGAIAHGLFCFDDKENMLVSPAFINAYNLEQKVAVFPRVIVSPATLEEFKTNTKFLKPGHTYKAEAQHVYNLLRLDKDGYYFVDYLKAIHMEIEPEDYTEFVELHKDLIIKGFTDADAKVRTKYIWLSNYHNEVVKEIFKKDVADKLCVPTVYQIQKP